MIRPKLIKTKTILEKKLIKVLEKEWQTNSGKKIHYDVRIKPVVVVLPIDSSGKIYLIKQYREIFQKTILEVVAGRIDDGETPLISAKRELKEEVGITAKKWQKIAEIYMSASVVYNKYYIYLVKDFAFGDSRREEDEEISLVHMTIADAVQDVINGKIATASSIITILLASKLLELKRL